MAADKMFSGLRVVDLAKFIAGRGAAVILSDFRGVPSLPVAGSE